MSTSLGRCSTEIVVWRCSVQKVFLKLCKVHRKTTGRRLFLIKLWSIACIYWEEPPAQVFSCICYEIFRITFLTEYLRATALHQYHLVLPQLQQLFRMSFLLQSWKINNFNIWKRTLLHTFSCSLHTFSSLALLKNLQTNYLASIKLTENIWLIETNSFLIGAFKFINY